MGNRLVVFIWTVGLLLLFGSMACRGQKNKTRPQAPEVKVGAEVLLNQYVDSLKSRRVGLVMNPTARVDGVHMLDTLLDLDVPVRALFAPEHGFRGRAAAGERIEDGVEQQTGLPVYSLYGDTRKPTAKMLQQVDLLLFDIQDVGARFYTYHVTMGRILEAAAKHDVPVWVLDRPNPAGGKYVSGWILQEKYKSFVGEYPIPVVHGLTMGELARMMVGEKWVKNADSVEMRVIPMKHWDRSMLWPQTGLKWYPPSPNLPTFESAYFYLGTAFFEGTSMSEGRGTPQPFLRVGDPKTRLTNDMIGELRERFPVNVRRHSFVPKSIPGKAPDPKYEGEKVRGVKLSINAERIADLDPLVFGLTLLKTMYNATPDVTLKDHLYRLAGTRQIKSFLMPEDSTDPGSYWEDEVEAFREQRKPYLIY